MKALCPKPGKGGKIHPSPPAGDDPAAVALRLLPAAILALTVALLPEDQQVLAYLVTRSLQGAAVPVPEQPGAGGRARRRRAHAPAIGCGCFDCYTSFWSRWDCSPDRELIHVAIDAFEEHLAAAESANAASTSASSTPSSSKRRDKGKRKPPPPMSPSSPKSPEPQAEKVQEASPPPPSPPPAPPAPAASTEAEVEKAPEASLEAEVEGEAVEDVEEGEERKRGWADVMGMLNLRLWGIWSPAVESAT